MYVTLSISRSGQCLLPWRMFEAQLDWTFAKLLEVASSSVASPEQLSDMEGVVPVCELSKEINSPSADRVQVPLSFNIDQCCRINGSFIRYLYPFMKSAECPFCVDEPSKEIRWPDKNFGTPQVVF